MKIGVLRLWEIIPGASVWLTFAVLFVFSRAVPFAVAFFIIF